LPEAEVSVDLGIGEPEFHCTLETPDGFVSLIAALE
jgi:hypothetical protein